ncbi:hypothetical protein ACFX2C_047160 [Malus domestica]
MHFDKHKQGNHELNAKATTLHSEMGKLPELEIGKAADEGGELIGSAGWEGGVVGVGEVVDLWVDLRREKPDKEVANVDPQGIQHHVEALDQVHA